MRHDFFPDNEAAQLEWSKGFRDRLLANPAECGVSVEQAEAFAEAADRFAETYGVANSTQTCGKSRTHEKNLARRAMERMARMLSRQIKGMAHVSDQTRIELRLKLNYVGKPPQYKAPTEAPQLQLISVVGHSINVRVSDSQAPTRRARPHGVARPHYFFFIGENPPAGEEGWSFDQTPPRMRQTLYFDPMLPIGTKVWICARWATATGKVGPMCEPNFQHLGYGGGIKPGGLAA